MSRDGAAGERFEARRSLALGLVATLICVSCLAFSVWVIGNAADFENVSRRPWASERLVTVMGIVCLAIFGGLTWLCVGILHHRGPILRIDEKGVTWARWSEAIIPWSAVERLRITRVQGHRVVLLWLHDPAAHRATTWSGRIACIDRMIGRGDIMLTIAGTDRSFAELLAAVERFAPQSLPKTVS